jgi:hypothetical protein
MKKNEISLFLNTMKISLIRENLSNALFVFFYCREIGRNKIQLGNKM